MKMLKLFLVGLALFFALSDVSLSETNVRALEKSGSIYHLLLKLEDDIKAGKPKTVISRDVDLIKEAKRNLPVSHVPELNYLVSPGVEKVPSTEVSLLKKAVYYVYPFEVAVKVFLFLLLFYTVVFYFQNIEAQPLTKRLFTLVGVVALVVAFVANISLLIYATVGFGFVLLTVLKKRKLLTYLMASLLFLFLSQLLWENAFVRLKSKEVLYHVKVTRDGYVPHYFVEEVFQNRKDVTLEEVTSDLALGKLDSVKRLKGVKVTDPFRQAVIFNDLGYVEFLRGRYSEALAFFEKALKLYSSTELKYNLYLTYSSLLKLEDANRLKEELLQKGVSVEKLPPVPVLIHLSVPMPGYIFPFDYFLAFVLGVLVGVLFVKFFLATFGSFEPELLLLPGMRNYINSNVKHIFLISLAVLVVNFILGSLICSV